MNLFIYLIYSLSLALTETLRINLLTVCKDIKDIKRIISVKCNLEECL